MYSGISEYIVLFLNTKQKLSTFFFENIVIIINMQNIQHMYMY